MARVALLQRLIANLVDGNGVQVGHNDRKNRHAGWIHRVLHVRSEDILVFCQKGSGNDDRPSVD